jgi:two-component system cell cycle sensor histidine kinase/response regulator CckA
LHYTNDAIFIMDLNRRIQFWNAGCERIFGWNRQEIIESEITEIIFDCNSEVLSLLDSMPDIEHWSGELGVTIKSGDHRKIEVRLNLLKDKDGKHDGVLAIVADITEKHALEECYVRAQRLESLSTLAAGVAHDLNNVFTPVTMAVELLRSVELPPDELEDLLQTVDGSVERGSAIIKQLVAFGKGAEGKNIVFQPKHLIREVVNIIQKTFPQGIEVQSEVLRDSWVIRGDQIQFHQLLMNLFLNARDAMPKGGKIQIRTDNVTIDEHFPSIDIDLEPGRYIQVTVVDDGEGMEKEVQEKVFEPFFTTRPVGRGSGLGLTNVLGIVKSFNGFIQCQSEPGKGTKFEVFLPALFENESVHTAYDPADHQGNGETILIVDDEEAVRDTTQKLLLQNGYKTLKAVDGVDAISVYGRNQGQIKIVVTDLKMPNMDGISLVRILRNMNPDLPVLVVSGHPDEHDIELLEPYTSIHLLEKPHKSGDLLHWVHHLLHQDEVQV